jgi:hypothetical protein
LFSLFIFAMSICFPTALVFLNFSPQYECFLSWCVLALSQRLALELNDGMTYDDEMYVTSDVYRQTKTQIVIYTHIV